MKTCSRCRESKPVESFSVSRERKSGRQNTCKACMQRYNASRRVPPAEVGEKICPKCSLLLPLTEYGTHKRHSDGRQTVCRKCKSSVDYAYWSSSTERKWKHKARSAVRTEIRAGRMKPQPCGACGAAKAQAHHHKGYEREHWLDVEWLCVDCHAKEHSHVA